MVTGLRSRSGHLILPGMQALALRRIARLVAAATRAATAGVERGRGGAAHRPLEGEGMCDGLRRVPQDRRARGPRWTGGSPSGPCRPPCRRWPSGCPRRRCATWPRSCRRSSARGCTPARGRSGSARRSSSGGSRTASGWRPTAERYAAVVFAALAQAVSDKEYADLTAVLPNDFGALLPRGPDTGIVPAERFLARVAERAGLNPDAARRATDAVLEVLAERIAAGEV